jgi:hypothetical protein
MSTFDAKKNFGKVTVSTGYDASATSIVLATDHGARLPAPATDGEFNLVWWNNSDYGDPTDDPNKEIVRCTARSTDTLTVTRNQESSGASVKNASGKTYRMALTVTKKVMDDIQDNIALVTGGADGTYYGVTQTGTAGATLAYGNLCYFQAADSRWELADANLSAGYDKKLGICVLAAASDGDATKMLLIGNVRADAVFPTMTIGSPMYMSETAGLITGTQPTTTDACIRVVGFANTADELYFAPSGDYITHT